MTDTHAGRRARLRAQLPADEVDAVLVTDPLDVRYLTGFTGSNAALALPVGDGPEAEAATVLATDGRYTAQVAAQVPDVRAVIERASAAAALAALPARARVGFDAEDWTVAAHTRMVGVAGARTLVPLAAPVAALRAVKDETEIALIERACAIADQALAELLEAGGLRPGRSEREVARDLEWRMLDAGADAVGFETIVAAGAHSAIPHHRPTDALLAAGDLVKIDFGARVDGYHSDMTRTLVLGAPADWQRELYALVAAAQQAGVDAVRAGAEAAAVDTAAREVIAAAGAGELFTHAVGHGIGLAVHEAPAVSARATGTLPCGAAITVEPGVYHPGRGGVRIEDTVIVRADGAQILTGTRKDLVIV